MEDSCKNFKRECVNSSSSPSSACGQAMTLDLSLVEVQRERRHIRREILRCRRAGVACDDSVMSKKRRLDECYPDAASVSCSSSNSVVTAEMDANKIRQLRNRESAERSRQKKDSLVDSLTCQVCELFVQLSDLINENNWLQEQQAFALGGRSPCGSESFVAAEEASVHSPITSCDEFDSDSDFDDACSVSSAPRAPQTPTTCLDKLTLVTPPSPPSTPYVGVDCSSVTTCASSVSSATGDLDDFGDDFADMIDGLDTWLEQEAAATQAQFAF